jgi:hypothetical protein
MYLGGGASSYLAGYLVKDDSDQFVRKVGVMGLEDAVRSIEDYYGVTGHVDLEGWS